MPTENEIAKYLKGKGLLEKEISEITEELKESVRRSILVRIVCADVFKGEKPEANPFTNIFSDIKFQDRFLSVYSITPGDEENTLFVELNDRTSMSSIGIVEVTGTKEDFANRGYKEENTDEFVNRFSNVYWAIKDIDEEMVWSRV